MLNLRLLVKKIIKNDWAFSLRYWLYEESYGYHKVLKDLKGKVLDAAKLELLLGAYEMQEANISQLKTNNNAFTKIKTSY